MSSVPSTVHSPKKVGVDGLIGYGVFYLCFLYLPILLIPLFSFNDSVYIAFPIESFTLQWYTQMFEEDALHRSLFNSIKVGACVSVISTIFGTEPAFPRSARKGYMSCGGMKMNWRSGCVSHRSLRVSTARLR